MLCTFPFFFFPSPLLLSSGLSLNHCSVRLVLAVGRVPCVLSGSSASLPLFFGYPPARHFRPSKRESPIPPQHCQFRLWLLATALHVPSSLLSSSDCIVHFVCRPVSYHCHHRCIGYLTTQYTPIELIRAASVGHTNIGHRGVCDPLDSSVIVSQLRVC